MKKNDRVKVMIEDVTYEGLGVAKVEGYPLFIEDALPGEHVTVHVMKMGKRFGYAKVIQWHTTSKDRVPLIDPNGTRVGTMPLQHMRYQAQLMFKQQQVKRVLSTIAKMPELEVLPTIGMDDPFHYRNKAQIPVREVAGQLSTGFFKKNSHELIPIETFYIQDEIIDRIIVQIRDVMRDYQIKPYNEKDHTGDLRHIIVRRGLRTEEVMVVLVTRTRNLFSAANMIEDLVAKIPQIVSIVQNVQTKRTNVIMGDETIVLYGEDEYREILMNLNFKISSRSFFQINTKQTEILYQKVLEAAALTGQETVVDAYCGIGTMSLALAKRAKKVYAMEIVPDAIRMAHENAIMNRISNVHFVTGAAEILMPQWAKEGLKPHVIVVDPPRKGLTIEFIEAAVQTNAQKIIYVSCNPATLARDIALFAQKGYQVKFVQPVDMFPMTTHVECVALLTRK